MGIRSVLGPLELIVGGIFIALARAGVSLTPLTLAGAGLVLLRVGWATVAAAGLPKRLTHGGLWLFLSSALVGVRLAYDPALSWPSLTAIIGGAWLFYAVLDIAASVENLTAALLLAGSFFSLWFIFAYSTFDYQPKIGLIHRLGQTIRLFEAGSFGQFDRNAVASSLEGLFLPGLGLLIYHRRNRILGLIVTSVIGYGLLLTVSRGSWIAIGLTGLIWLGFRLAEKRDKIGGGLIWVISLFGLLLLLSLSLYWLPLSFFTADSGRSELFGNVRYLWRDTWLTGIGLGQPFTLIYSRFVLLIDVPYLKYAHNIFLQIGLGQGILGLIGFSLLLIGVYLDVARNRPKTPLAARPLFDAAWLGLTAILLHGLVDATQFIEFLSLPALFILLGLIVHLCRTKIAWPILPNFSWVPAGALAVALVVGVIGWRAIAADFYVNRGALEAIAATLSPDLSESQRQRQREQASRDLQQALQYDPAHRGAQRWLGMIAYQNEEYVAAVAYFERALATEPDNFTLWKGLGYAYLWAGKFDAAKPLLEKVPEAPLELSYWAQWWRSQQQPHRAQLAIQMQQAIR